MHNAKCGKVRNQTWPPFYGHYFFQLK